MAPIPILLVTFLAAETAGLAADCFVRGMCTDGSLYPILDAGGVIDCLEACKADGKCTWFTYNDETAYCGIHESCENRTTSVCDICVSGPD